MTLNNFLEVGLKSNLCIQFRDVVGNQTIDYTFRKTPNKEFVEKLVWEGQSHTLQPVEQLNLSEAISEIIAKVEKTKKTL